MSKIASGEVLKTDVQYGVVHIKNKHFYQDSLTWTRRYCIKNFENTYKSDWKTLYKKGFRCIKVDIKITAW